MSNDISVCNGCIGKIAGQLQYCPIRDNCLRNYLFKQWSGKNTRTGALWQVVAEYKDGKCELQIKIKDEKDNVQ